MTNLHRFKRFSSASARGLMTMAAWLTMFLLLISITPAQSQTVIADVPVAPMPISVAVNPVTNKIYVSCLGNSNVTVIDGATNSTMTLKDPNANYVQQIAVNPVTNRIYVANFNSSNVTVIDGATNSISTVKDPNASGSHFVAVNSATNKIYVANWNTNNVTVIDGATYTTTSVPTGANPHFIAINDVTNRIYVPNWGSGDITVIDGGTNSTTTVKDPNASNANVAAVNSVTNKIYVSDYGSNNVTVIDGVTNSFTTLTDPNAIHPYWVALNPLTNKIYIINGNSTFYGGSNNITVIDGATNSTTTIKDPNANQSSGAVVDSVHNKVYVVNWASNNVTVLDGASNSTTTVTDPKAIHPNALDINPETNRVYVVNGDEIYGGSNNVTVIAGAAATPTFKTLVSLDSSVGTPFNVSLIQATDGSFYGTTDEGGTGGCHGNYGCGTVFKVTQRGTLTTLHSFNGADGDEPYAGLVQGTDGNFYGTTFGGTNHNTLCSIDTVGCGTIFRITPTVKLTTLYSFCTQANCADGANPQTALIQAADGNFYGTTLEGGAYGYGTVFKVTQRGTLTTLYSFDVVHGKQPSIALVQATDGNFYGETGAGGTNNVGTVFRITPEGTLTTLHSFGLSDGAYPGFGRLVQASDGNFYGITNAGGPDGWYGCGTVFKITPRGILTTLHSFDCTYSGGGYNGLVQGTDGNFYGTTAGGTAANTHGTIFRITPRGILATLHSFDGTDGDWVAYNGMFQETDGRFYGITANGGVYGWGTVFSISTGLAPFVAFIRDSGKVGQTAQILGQGFTGTTSVSFNGAPAKFAVVSDTYLTATVPAGATAGFATVTTPSGTLTSNKTFYVVPQINGFSPTGGPIGTSVVITGSGFAGAIHAHFGGVLATNFTVDSDTQITATVPSGATTGKVSVCTLGKSAQSATSFTVTP